MSKKIFFSWYVQFVESTFPCSSPLLPYSSVHVSQNAASNPATQIKLLVSSSINNPSPLPVPLPSPNVDNVIYSPKCRLWPKSERYTLTKLRSIILLYPFFFVILCTFLTYIYMRTYTSWERYLSFSLNFLKGVSHTRTKLESTKKDAQTKT